MERAFHFSFLRKYWEDHSTFSLRREGYPEVGEDPPFAHFKKEEDPQVDENTSHHALQGKG